MIFQMKINTVQKEILKMVKKKKTNVLFKIKKNKTTNKNKYIIFKITN